MSSNKRSIQRKLNTVIEDFFRLKPELKTFLQEIDTKIPFFGLFFHTGNLTEYMSQGNLNVFRGDAVEAFKALSHVRGKKREALEIGQLFDNLLVQSFPELSGKGPISEVIIDDSSTIRSKRAKSSIESSNVAAVDTIEKTPKKSIKEEVPEEIEQQSLTKTEKASIRHILNNLSKLEHADAFLYPVDSRQYPEYYEFIKKPVDITYIKDNLNKYSTVNEVLTDIRLMWENCREFNIEGSEIISWSEELAMATENLIEEYLGSDYKLVIQKKRGGGRPRKDRLSTVAVDPIAKVPKTEEKIVLAPIKASTSKKAVELNIMPEEKLTEKANKRVLEAASSTLSKKTLQKILNEIKNHDLSFPFHYPVSEESAPGYFDVISMPMDLHTIEKRLKSNQYENSTIGFISDVNQIWKNCLTYNDPESSIAELAINLGTAFDEIIRKYVSSELSNANAKNLFKVLDNYLIELNKGYQSENDEDNEEGEEVENTNLDANTSTTAAKITAAIKKRRGRLPGKFKKSELSSIGKALWSLIEEIKEDPRSKPFYFPVSDDDAPGYSDIIKHPMDLSTIKSNLQNYESQETVIQFYNDILLVFNNCQIYNSETSEIYRWASQLKSLADEKFNQYFERVGPNSYDVARSAVLKKRRYNAKKRSANESFDDFGDVEVDDTDLQKALNPVAPIPAIAKNILTIPASHFLKTQSSSSQAFSEPSSTVGITSKSHKKKESMFEAEENIDVQTTAEIDTNLAILRSDVGVRTKQVKELAANKSQELLAFNSNKYFTSFIFSPNLFEISNFGLINSNPGFHESHCIYPVSYRSTRLVQIRVVPVNSTDANIQHSYFPIAITSTVSIQNNIPRFQLLIDGGVVVTDGTTPKLAWEQLLESNGIGRIVQIHSNRLKNCKAVLNRISIEDSAKVFLEFNTNDESLATFDCPICLHEIYHKLKLGYYDHEFDFAWDVRYLFRRILLPASINGENNSGIASGTGSTAKSSLDKSLITHKEDSEIYKRTSHLMSLFEYLFSKWVLNFQHRTINDLATGPWSNWYKLMYYDDPAEWSVRESKKQLVVTAVEREDSAGLPSETSVFCHLCFDTLESNVISTNSVSIQEVTSIADGIAISGLISSQPNPPTKQLCPRCDLANADSVPSLADYEVIPRHKAWSYRREDVNLSCFVPNFEVGFAWFQSLRLRRGGFRNTFLSPLGFVFKDKLQDMDIYQNIEDRINKSLEVELFQIYRLRRANQSNDISMYDNSSRRNFGLSQVPSTWQHWHQPVWTTEKMHDKYPTDIIESGVGIDLSGSGAGYRKNRFTIGKLVDYKLPPGSKFAVFIPSNEADVIKTVTVLRKRDDVLNSIPPAVSIDASGDEWIELTPDKIPKLGYYGLDVPDIRVRLEGLASLDLCTQYSQLTTEYYRQILIEDLTKKRELNKLKDEKEIAVIEIIQHERWIWQKKHVLPEPSAVPGERLSKNEEINLLFKKGFRPLLPATMSSKYGELLICIWDLLDGIGSVIGEYTFSLYEILMCLDLNTQNPSYHSLGQVIFDEIGCLFASILLQNLKTHLISVEEYEWQTLLLHYPVNVITWPFVLRHMILCSDKLGWSQEASYQLLSGNHINSNGITAPSKGNYSWRDVGLDVICLFRHHPLMLILQKLQKSQSNDTHSTEFYYGGDDLMEIEDFSIASNDPVKGLQKSIHFIQQKFLENQFDSIYEFINSLSIALNDFSNSTSKSDEAECDDINISVENPSSALLHKISLDFIHWFRNLCGRWNLSNDEYRMDIASNSVDNSGKDSNALYVHDEDFYGAVAPYLIEESLENGYVLKPTHLIPSSLPYSSNYIFSTSINLAADKATKDVAQSLFIASYSQHSILEKTLLTLRVAEVDDWSSEDKINILSTCLEWVVESNIYQKQLKSTKQTLNMEFKRIDDIPLTPPSYKLLTSGGLSTQGPENTNNPSLGSLSATANIMNTQSSTSSASTAYPQLATVTYNPAKNVVNFNNPLQGSNLPNIGGNIGSIMKSLEYLVLTEEQQKQIRCCFTGSTLYELTQNSTRNNKFVVVPDNYLNPIYYQNPVIGKLNLKKTLPAYVSINITDDSKYCGRYVTLESFLLRIQSAREIAQLEKIRIEKRIQEITATALHIRPNEVFTSNWMNGEFKHLRSQPLGFDRYGSSYWLLHAQENMTVYPLGNYNLTQVSSDAFISSITTAATPGSTIANASKPAIDPLILVRHSSGWWGSHAGHQLSVLIDSFSPQYECEKILYENLIRRYVYTRGKLYSSTLRSKSQQFDWLFRRYRLETALKELKCIPIPKTVSSTILVATSSTGSLDSNVNKSQALRVQPVASVSPSLNPTEICRQLELVWMRSVEIRQFVHYSMLLKNDYDSEKSSTRVEKENILKRQQRIKDTNSEDTLDLHPSKGWLRFHCLSQLRSLSATTNATRILCDASFWYILKDFMNKSEYRSKWIKLTVEAATAAVVTHATEVTQSDKVTEIIATNVQLNSTSITGSNMISNDAPAEIASADNQETMDIDDSGGNVTSTSENKFSSTTSAPSTALPLNDGSSLLSTAAATANPETASDDNYATQGRVKPVEQIRLDTGEVVRLHPSGKAAATFMGVSQAQISLCCSGKQAEAYGFRWRIYEGPPVDWESIRDRQLSLDQIKTLAVNRKKSSLPSSTMDTVASGSALFTSVGTADIPQYPPSIAGKNNPYGIPEGQTSLLSSQPPPAVSSSSAVVQSDNAASQSALAPPVVIPGTSLPNAQIPLTSRHIITSNVILSARFLKLKAELLSIFFIFPHKQLKWAEVFPQGTVNESGSGIGDSTNVTTTTSADELLQPANDSSRDRKAKRKEHRRMVSENYVSRILNADTASELGECLELLRDLIPSKFLLSYNRDHLLPRITLDGDSDGSKKYTLAEVGLKLYTLDRAIRYDEMEKIESIISKLPQRPRINFAPRCMISPQCKLPLLHAGKCLTTNDYASRYVEISDALLLQQQQLLQQQLLQQQQQQLQQSSKAGTGPMGMAPRPGAPVTLLQQFYSGQPGVPGAMSSGYQPNVYANYMSSRGNMIQGVINMGMTGMAAATAPGYYGTGISNPILQQQQLQYFQYYQQQYQQFPQLLQLQQYHQQQAGQRNTGPVPTRPVTLAATKPVVNQGLIPAGSKKPGVIEEKLINLASPVSTEIEPVNIEYVKPFVPTLNKISGMEWI